MSGIDTIDQTYEDYLNQVSTSEESVREATAFTRARTGTYKLVVDKKEHKLGSEKSPWPGRPLTHASATLYDPTDGARRGKVFFDVSGLQERTRSGRLDAPALLFQQAAKALGLVGARNGDIVDALDRIPYKAFVEESFQTPEGWRTPKNDEDRRGYVEAGYKSENFVRSLSPLS